MGKSTEKDPFEAVDSFLGRDGLALLLVSNARYGALDVLARKHR